jgi:tetratricopeptide (TPR) repeat protein
MIACHDVLGNLCALLAVAEGVPSPDRGTIRHQVDDILARPEFRQKDLSWLLKALKQFFDWLGGLHDTAPLLFWILIVVLVTVLLLLIFHITWTVRQAFVTGEAAKDSRQAAEQRQRLSQAYQQQALDRAARGEYTEAIRFLFLSLVFRFDEEGRVLFQRAYTNREYLALFTDRPGVNAELRVFVDTLDDNWYGQRPSDPGRYQECLTLFEKLRRQA